MFAESEIFTSCRKLGTYMRVEFTINLSRHAHSLNKFRSENVHVVTASGSDLNIHSFMVAIHLMGCNDCYIERP